MKKVIYLLAGAVFTIASCTNSEKQTEETVTPPVEETTSAAPEANANEAVITLNAGDDMKFDLSEIKVKEGQTVKLTLTHTGKMAKTAMGHNFVLLAQGVVLADFAGKAIAASGTDYIPAGSEKEVIAHTKLIGGGESDTIEFTAPAKGSYEFLCSFAGHSALMKGTFIVE
ncbi:MAG: azurin [Pedobacter sp.]|uniref:azurin n=1 Tax=Pedobacter sp. TaxID=1411316 RepID=UPI002807C86E|nr:azurin [Pedobacter sp.]MDQ8006723.1 azurin [Pedobacter sp.]